MTNAQSVETVMDRAVKKRPATIAKVKPRGVADRKFQAFTVSQLLETYRDPRAVLLELASMDTHKLAELAKCTYLEAVAERRLCAQAVLPYVAQKLPVQVDMRHTRAIHLNIVDQREYQQLQAIASADEQGMQLIAGAVVEDIASDDTQGAAEGDGTHELAITERSVDPPMLDRTDVLPAVTGAAPEGSEPSK